MAINFHIDSSSGATKRKAVNSASASTRAQQAKSALVGASQASDAGNTAVASKGILGKVGKYLPAVAEVASNFLPGAAGNIVKGIANAFNDPEWWQTVPGDACTQNQPLRLLTGSTEDVITNSYGLPYTEQRIAHTRFRPAMAEFVSLDDGLRFKYVITPSETAITQYLMPEIRKVVNAVPLQSAADYKRVLQVNATLYAIWRTLKKFDYMLKHGQTYLPSMNEATFPILQVENSAKLAALINRIEEYLRANVRLPHTLCEYEAWRFGRIYKSCQTGKAGLIMYNAMSLETPVIGEGATNNFSWETVVNSLMAELTSTTALQAANADMFNAYFDHDLMVEIADHTQFCYDAKEFALRTNCDILSKGYEDYEHGGLTIKFERNDNPNPVFIDSSLDNPTTFMASTISTLGTQQGVLSTDDKDDILYPISDLKAYIAHDAYAVRTGLIFGCPTGIHCDSDGQFYKVFVAKAGCVWTSWSYAAVNAASSPTAGDAESYYQNTLVSGFSDMGKIMSNILMLKPLDIYNKDVYLMMSFCNRIPNYDPGYQVGSMPMVDSYEAAHQMHVDVTSISYDMAAVTDDTIGVEHVYAFANLVAMGRKTSTGYAQAEKLVARDTANLVEKLDVAAVK